MAITLAMTMMAAGCGTDESDPDGPPVTNRVQVADARFDGRFFVTAVTVGGEEVALLSIPAVEIETQFGGLLVEPGCKTYFGSFTLAEGGDASFTIAGGSDETCEELADQEQAVLAALRGATSWSETGEGFRFDGPDSSIIIISR